MTRPTEIKTTDIDLAAAVMTANNARPVPNPGISLVEFSFDDNAENRSIVVAYSTGGLKQDVKKFAANRSWLYRLAREAAQTRGIR